MFAGRLPDRSVFSSPVVSAWYLLRRARDRISLGERLSLGMGAACILIAISGGFVGDRVGDVIEKHQPAKTRCCRGVVGTSRHRLPRRISGSIVPDQKGQRKSLPDGDPVHGLRLADEESQGHHRRFEET